MQDGTKSASPKSGSCAFFRPLIHIRIEIEFSVFLTG